MLLYSVFLCSLLRFKARERGFQNNVLTSFKAQSPTAFFKLRFCGQFPYSDQVFWSSGTGRGAEFLRYY